MAKVPSATQQAEYSQLRIFLSVIFEKLMPPMPAGVSPEFHPMVQLERQWAISHRERSAVFARLFMTWLR
jgi:hypothetical protein